jgi:hypothetical protein
MNGVRHKVCLPVLDGKPIDSPAFRREEVASLWQQQATTTLHYFGVPLDKNILGNCTSLLGSRQQVRSAAAEETHLDQRRRAISSVWLGITAPQA